MDDLTPVVIRLNRERVRQRDGDVSGYEMPVTTLLDHAQRLETENRRLLRGIEAISSLGDGEGRRLARLILEGADTHAWRLGRDQQDERKRRLTWTAGK